MKKLVALFLLLIGLLALTACGTTVDEDIPHLNERFEYMYQGHSVNGNFTCYYRDTVTDIVYVKIGNGMSVMLKADGTPYLWSELLKGE